MFTPRASASTSSGCAYSRSIRSRTRRSSARSRRCCASPGVLLTRAIVPRRRWNLLVVDRVHGGFLGARAGPVDAFVLADHRGVDVLAGALVGRQQPAGALASDLATDVTVDDLDVLLGLGLLPDLGLLLVEALCQR